MFIPSPEPEHIRNRIAINAAITLGWQSLEEDRTERLQLTPQGLGFLVTSQITGLVLNQPADLRYNLLVDSRWRWLRFDLWDRGNLQVSLVRGREQAQPYLDFVLTPFTNSLVINGEQLALGRDITTEVLYINYPLEPVVPVQQYYRRLNHSKYLFRHLGTYYEQNITVDESGFVTEYPGLFRRV